MEVERQANLWTISLKRTFGLDSAAELKAALLESLAAGVSLQLDLRHCEMSIPLLQMLWTARLESKRLGVPLTALGSEEAIRIIRGAGFDQFFENPSLINQCPINK